MIVRRAQPEDADALAEGMKAVADEGRWLATTSSVSQRELTERFRRGLEQGHVVFALEDEGRLVGCLGMHPTSAAGVLSLGMWILAAWRGRGGGRQLVDAAIEQASSSGLHKLELEVFPDNSAAIALYASAGFEVEGLRRSHYRRPDGSLRSALLMARLLVDAG